MCCSSGIVKGTIIAEEGIDPDVLQKLRTMGHNISGTASGIDRAILGRGQIITRGAWWDKSSDGHICKDTNLYWAGSDPRCDGVVAAY